MENNHKKGGTALITVLVVLIVLLIGAGIYYLVQITKKPAGESDISAFKVPTTTTTQIANPAKLVKNPYLIYPDDNSSMTLMWQTDKITTVNQLKWGSDEKYQDGQIEILKPINPGEFLYHHTISSLKSGTKTFYELNIDNKKFTGSFLTAPKENVETLSFYGYGDTRSQTDIYDKVASQMLADIFQNPSEYQTFALHAGDAVGDGSKEDNWQNQFFNPDYKNTFKLLSEIPVLVAVGNHDLKKEDNTYSGALFRKYFPYPFYQNNDNFYYSFDYGAVHVAVLDQYTAKYDKDSEQKKWLENDLVNTKKKWKVVMFHKPAYSAGGGHDDSNTTRNDITPILEKYGVQVVLQGHNHYYARAAVNNVFYLTLGAGGAPLHHPDTKYEFINKAISEYSFARFDIADSLMNVSVINVDGEEIDKFTIPALVD